MTWNIFLYFCPNSIECKMEVQRDCNQTQTIVKSISSFLITFANKITQISIQNTFSNRIIPNEISISIERADWIINRNEFLKISSFLFHLIQTSFGFRGFFVVIILMLTLIWIVKLRMVSFCISDHDLDLMKI